MFSRANCAGLLAILRQKICLLLIVSLVFVVAVNDAHAGLLYNFDGSLDGETQDATAEFTFGTNTLQIELNNLFVNPKSVIQNISALIFTIADPPTLTVASLTSSSATKRTINDGGVYSDGASGVSTKWSLIGPAGQVLELNWNNGTGPAETIVGLPDGGNVYSNANNSIANTGGPHNPFLYSGPVIFNLSITGVTASTTLVANSVLMQFGTEDGSNRIIGVPEDPPPPTVHTPEPGSFLVFAGLGMAFGTRRFRRRRGEAAA